MSKKNPLAKRQQRINKSLRSASLRCLRGCGKGKPGDRFCTKCGDGLPVSVVKAAEPQLPYHLRHMVNSPDPAEREMAWKAQYDLIFKKG